jgi:hypothetical protein
MDIFIRIASRIAGSLNTATDRTLGTKINRGVADALMKACSGVFLSMEDVTAEGTKAFKGDSSTFGMKSSELVNTNRRGTIHFLVSRDPSYKSEEPSTNWTGAKPSRTKAGTQIVDAALFVRYYNKALGGGAIAGIDTYRWVSDLFIELDEKENVVENGVEFLTDPCPTIVDFIEEVKKKVPPESKKVSEPLVIGPDVYKWMDRYEKWLQKHGIMDIYKDDIVLAVNDHVKDPAVRTTQVWDVDAVKELTDYVLHQLSLITIPPTNTRVTMKPGHRPPV